MVQAPSPDVKVQLVLIGSHATQQEVQVFLVKMKDSGRFSLIVFLNLKIK